MVSAEAYVELVEKFYAKYKTLMSEALKTDITNVLEWGIGYNKVMSAGRDYDSTQMKIAYLKRGANLMAYFIEAYEKESDEIKEKLRQCRLILLNPKKPKPTWCTEEKKNILLAFGINLDVFTSEFIGCADAASKYLLNVLKRNSKLLGNDYKRVLNKMEFVCMHIDTEKIR